MITILVGANKTKFAVHESVLKPNCDYFQRALDGHWQESKNKEFVLDEENETVFEFYVHYLYHHLCQSDAKLNVDYNNEHTESFLIEAYILGDRRGCDPFENAAMNTLSTHWDYNQTLPSMSACNVIFTQTAADDKMRRLIAERWFWESNLEWLEADKIELDQTVNADFAIAVLKIMASCTKPRMNLGEMSACPYRSGLCSDYHSHKEGESCEKKEEEEEDDDGKSICVVFVYCTEGQ